MLIKFQAGLAAAGGLAILVLMAVGILSCEHSNDADDLRSTNPDNPARWSIDDLPA